MDHSALLFMVKIFLPGTHMEASEKHSLICRSLYSSVTWNSELFPDNASTIVELTYITADQQLAWSSRSVENIRGYVNVYFDTAWLLGASGNDTTLGVYIYGVNGSYLVHTPLKPHNPTFAGYSHPPAFDAL